MMIVVKIVLILLILFLVLLGWKNAKGSEDLGMPQCYKELFAYNAVVVWVGAIILIVKLVRM